MGIVLSYDVSKMAILALLPIASNPSSGMTAGRIRHLPRGKR